MMFRKASLFFILVLLTVVYAVPQVTIHSVKVLPNSEVDIEDGTLPVDDGSGIQIDGPDDDDSGIKVVDRAPQEAAIFAVKKSESGYARTTNVGLTVQKGTSGTIHFKIRAKAATVEQIASLSKKFEKSLTKSEKKSLRKLKKKYDGGFDIPWLHSLGINLDEDVSAVDIEKAAEQQVRYNERATIAKQLLEEVTVQNIEVSGTLTAEGVSFIPTTVFSFIKIARVQFVDDSKLTVISKHLGNLAAGTKDGSTTLPTRDGEIKILNL